MPSRRFAIPAPSTARVSLVVALQVQERDGYVCVYCGDAPGEVHVDHARPLAHFPATAPPSTVNAPSNLVTACAPCNQAKGPQNLPGFAAMLRGRGLPAKAVTGMLRAARAATRRPLPNAV